MKVNDIMNKRVITLSPADTLYDVIRQFAKKGISGAPVVDRSGKVIGLVHDIDLTRALDSAPTNIQSTSSKLLTLMFASLRSKTDGDRLNCELKEAKKIKVRSFMSPPTTIHENCFINDAVRDMASSGITRLAVVNDSKKLVGIVARADLIRGLEKSLPK